MDLAELTRRAEEIRARFDAQAIARGTQPWSRAEIAQGFVGDVGDLMKLVMAKEGLRPIADVEARPRTRGLPVEHSRPGPALRGRPGASLRENHGQTRRQAAALHPLTSEGRTFSSARRQPIVIGVVLDLERRPAGRIAATGRSPLHQHGQSRSATARGR
jgi:hypothetical protein